MTPLVIFQHSSTSEMEKLIGFLSDAECDLQIKETEEPRQKSLKECDSFPVHLYHQQQQYSILSYYS